MADILQTTTNQKTGPTSGSGTNTPPRESAEIPLESDKLSECAGRPAHIFPLSHNQEYLWFLHKLNPTSAAYVIPMAWRVRGPLNVEVLQASLNTLVERHDALRLRFCEINNRPFQYPATERAEWPIEQHDLSTEAPSRIESRLAGLLDLELAKPVILAESAPIRGVIFHLGPEDHAILLLVHHIVCDDWSCAILSSELSSLYASGCQGLPHALPPGTTRFVDFASRHREERSRDGFKRELSFWLQRLEPQLEQEEGGKFFNWNATETGGTAGARVPIFIPQAVVQKLIRFGGSRKATLFMTLLAGLHSLLHRCSRQATTMIGVPATGRLKSEVESIVGYFVNTLPHGATFSKETTFENLLEQVRNTSIECLSHSDIPLGLLVERLKQNKTSSAERAPLLSSMFTLRQAERDFSLHNLQTEALPLPCRSSQFPLSLWLVQRKTGLHGYFTYATACLEEHTARSLASSYSNLLEAAVDQPATPLHRLPLLPPPDLKLVLEDWNATSVSLPTGECLHHLVAAQSAKTPDAICIQWGKFRMTYSELMKRSSIIASLLLSRGIKPGDHVGLCLRRTPNMIAAMLGVLKAGAAYVPLDPNYPKERLEFMVSDCMAALVLTESGVSRALKGCSSPLVEIDGKIRIPDASSQFPEVPPSSAAYLMYTSGSTGRPKGVVLEHRNAVNFVRWALSVYTPEDLQGVLAGTTIGFDLSIVEIFVTLSAGGTILLAENVLHIADVALSARISMVSTVPSAMEALLLRSPLPDSVTIVSLIGEPLSQSLVERLYAHPNLKKVYDLYGPAETTTCSTWSWRKPNEPPNVGRPIHNTRLYVLDSELQPVPPGITGELWIAGAGVARGYLNRPALNDQRFLRDPFVQNPEARMYATGDLVRHLPDGRLAYIGRNDSQVKIRGHRIELGEIESQLTGHPSIRQACVLVLGKGTSEAELIAFLGKNSGTSPTAIEIKAHLRARVPEFMIPPRIHILDQLPFNSNGKVNRDELLALATMEGNGRTGSASGSSKAEGILEHELLLIWKKILRVPELGVEDNFFESGGHSLLALSLFGEIEKKFGCKLPIAILFQHPTIRQIARIIEQGSWQSPNVSLVAIQAKGRFTPLFCVHAHGGHVLFYRDLATRIGEDYPLYGLQAPSLEGHTKPLQTVEEMAALYISEMQHVQASGPYQIAGYCAGGIIALEMARQLRKAGHEVSTLALIETYAPGYSMFPKGRPMWFRIALAKVQEMQMHLGSLQMLRLSEKIKYIQKRWRYPLYTILDALPGKLGQKLRSSDALDPLRETQRAIMKAVNSYRFDEYPGEVIIFKTLRPRFGTLPTNSLGWDTQKVGKITVYEAPGYPGALVLEPKVSLIAGQIRQHLKSS